MAPPRTDLFNDLERFVSLSGIQVRLRQMDLEKPGEFDGPTITINPAHDRQACCYYLAHSFGSIYQWSTDFEHARTVFEEIRDTKRGPQGAFEVALQRWRRFEEVSSDHAVWVLAAVGHEDAIDGYTVFFRADLEAMSIFHRTGKEPRWPDFFAEWKERVAKGEIRVDPFRPKPVARFRPVRIEKQEVLQERD
jgi:hypothetical protein